MEEQRARQEAEAAAASRETAGAASEDTKPAAAGLADDDAMLQKALSMSMDTDEAEVNLEAMTEEEQV
jgi:hypothetical protein